MPAVSVILPFHNAESTLARAIESIRVQSFADWELIAWDDGSTDTSLAVAQALAQCDARIRVLESPHAGLVEALRQACAQARGAILARMDADDVSLPHRLEKQVALLRADDRVALCGTLVSMEGAGIGSGRRRYEEWINGLIRHDDIVRERFIECPVAHPTFAMPRWAYDAAGGYQEHGWPEDYDLVLRLAEQGRIEKVPEALLEWHHHGTRLSMRDPRYEEAAFRRLKRHYLRKTVLAGRSLFHQWGAGEVGKRWLREWDAPKPAAVVDINPRKIGRVLHGIPVIAPETLPAPGETFVLIAVGAPGARDEIREWLTPRGYVERVDYAFIA